MSVLVDVASLPKIVSDSNKIIFVTDLIFISHFLKENLTNNMQNNK